MKGTTQLGQPETEIETQWIKALSLLVNEWNMAVDDTEREELIDLVYKAHNAYFNATYTKNS